MYYAYIYIYVCVYVYIHIYTLSIELYVYIYIYIYLPTNFFPWPLPVGARRRSTEPRQGQLGCSVGGHARGRGRRWTEYATDDKHVTHSYTECPFTCTCTHRHTCMTVSELRSMHVRCAATCGCTEHLCSEINFAMCFLLDIPLRGYPFQMKFSETWRILKQHHKS